MGPSLQDGREEIEVNEPFVNKNNDKEVIIEDNSATIQDIGDVPAEFRNITPVVIDRIVYIHSYNECGKKYSSMSNLNRHKIVHNYFTFICDECDFECKIKETLQRHIKTKHSNLPSLRVEFEICHKPYLTKRIMEMHKKDIHTIKDADFPYIQCPKSWKKKSTLHRHINDKH